MQPRFCRPDTLRAVRKVDTALYLQPDQTAVYCCCVSIHVLAYMYLTCHREVVHLTGGGEKYRNSQIALLWAFGESARERASWASRGGTSIGPFSPYRIVHMMHVYNIVSSTFSEEQLL